MLSQNVFCSYLNILTGVTPPLNRVEHLARYKSSVSEADFQQETKLREASYVCVCICTRIYVYMCAWIYMYVCIYLCVCACVYLFLRQGLTM
jgi:hypothetical protein